MKVKFKRSEVAINVGLKELTEDGPPNSNGVLKVVAILEHNP